ncbi:MAG: dihydrolipoyllysine-residue acetyltransferase [Gammaproteobacteria bacterium RIFCSPHIGHO2_12_FULL_37_14]|nr:MAG: dihydrolipoyllysine-residue acetyltransferase [Gammaproteobacteria bacterium RIFCSPHIGHO2_12_FULL_37_14]
MSLKNILTPDLGGVSDVTVIEILVKPGDTIEKDTTIVTLESDKATLEVPSTDAGKVKEIKVKVGDKVSTDSTLLILEATATEQVTTKETPSPPPKESQRSEKISTTSTIEEPIKTSFQQEEPRSQPILTGTLETNNDVHAGPGVRRLARELGVNLALVLGTGPKQRIVKEDVQVFVKTQLGQMQGGTTLAPFSSLPTIDFSKFGQVDVQALSRIKKISGKNLQRNWMMIPHVTQFGEADITSLEEFRQSQKADLEKQRVKLTPLVFVMKAAVASLKAFPHFNASLDNSGEHLVMKKYFHIGVAVDTPDGLVVPVVRDVDKKGLLELAKELAQLSEKARNKQLTPGEMQGGCFSISSLGGIGGTAFTPIINYPEVAILGVSKASYKPVYEEGTFVPHLMLPLSLSYDHRVIDGADGARFMNHITNMLSDIRNLLL